MKTIVVGVCAYVLAGAGMCGTMCACLLICILCRDWWVFIVCPKSLLPSITSD